MSPKVITLFPCYYSLTTTNRIEMETMGRRQFQSTMTSRERNRIHARKTRQRKKEQMQTLQSKAEQLKGEQITLKLSINEKNTASILCCLFSNNGMSQNSVEDPRIENLLQRPENEIPDPSKLSALQPLILPSGAQHSKKLNSDDSIEEEKPQHLDFPDDGIDYQLLGKDRSKCTPAELDQIRRERNRMHAKRTRDRKRLFMEEMSDMCKILEEENQLLHDHLDELNGVIKQTPQLQQSSVAMVSPYFTSTAAPTDRPFFENKKGLRTLLDAAGVFELSFNGNNNNRTSCAVSVSSEDHGSEASRPLKKRRRVPPPTSFTSSDED